MPTLLALITLCASPSFEIGQATVTWPVGEGAVTAEVYYPADFPGTGTLVARVEGGHPLVVFGPAEELTAGSYSYLIEGLVPHGYVVAFPASGGSSFGDHSAYAQTLDDIATALIEDDSDASSMFFERLSGRAAVLGHGLGGGASVLAASDDSTFLAVGSLAGIETTPSAIAAAGSLWKPLLVLSGGADCVAPAETNQAPLYAGALSSCRQHVTILEATHCHFAGPSDSCNGLGLPCPGTFGASDSQALVLELLTEWLDSVLRLDSTAWSRFEAALGNTSSVATESACYNGAGIFAIKSVPASQAGVVSIEGFDLAFLVNAQVAGRDVPILDSTFQQLSFELGTSAPGRFSLAFESVFSPTANDLGVPDGLARPPALTAEVGFGPSLEVELRTGTPSAFVVAWSTGQTPPQAIAGVYHALELAQPIHVLAVGTSGDFGFATLRPSLPPLPNGMRIGVQAYADLPTGPSFTNTESFVLK